MNEKIKALAVQAGGLEILDTRGFGERHEGVMFSQVELEKFAELVLRECIERVRDNEKTCDAVWDIVEHFGIEYEPRKA